MLLKIFLLAEAQKNTPVISILYACYSSEIAWYSTGIGTLYARPKTLRCFSTVIRRAYSTFLFVIVLK